MIGELRSFLTETIRRVVFALLLIALATSLAGVALAQEPAPAASKDLEQRVRELEEIIHGLQVPTSSTVQRAGLTASTPKPVTDAGQGEKITASTLEITQSEKKEEKKPAFTAGWDKGFLLQSEDKSFLLRFTGQIQGDYRAFLETNDRTDNDTFLVRRARLGIEATVANYYEFRLLPDFGQGQSKVQDAYLNIRYWDELQFEFGRFKQPFGFEQLIQDRFVPTVERSIIDQLVPQRDVGVMIHGQNLFDGRLDYGVAVSNGGVNGDLDTNDVKDFSGRVTVRPFYTEEPGGLLRQLRLGISGTTGKEEEAIFPNLLRTPATVPWFQYNAAVRADGVRNRWSPEVSYFYQGLGFAAQYFRQDQKLRPAFFGAGSKTLIDLPSEGFFVMTTLLLTGEERTGYSEAISPLRPFDPHCWTGFGAWELVARVSRLELGDAVFAPGTARLADPTRFSRGATEMTLGFNWYLNQWVRAQMNWEHAWFDEAVRLGPGLNGLFRHEDTLLARMQVIF